jgi:hypothetical protein
MVAEVVGGIREVANVIPKRGRDNGSVRTSIGTQM